MTSAKPKVRLLVAVWGPRYVRVFADLTLTALLAQDNLPALARMTELEVVMLTGSTDRPLFECEPAFQRLAQLAPVSFIAIDDLIPGGLYGITLTLGYLRGMVATGERMTDTYFVFLNADLILANGSLRSLGERILRGERAILACSIRAISEELEPKLRAMVDRDHVLAVPPRTLVDLTLRAMHPTQIAKIVNSSLCHSRHVNQFYWQVDANTLVSRHFLMFMLCLRPERVVTEVRAFCDYAFVPEMCPTTPSTAMADSDEFFFLEMQARESERDFLSAGRQSVREIAAGLSRWTTAMHRDCSLRHTLVFHAAELPPQTSAAIDEADRYIKAIHAELENPPQPYRDHPYWTGTCELWRRRQAKQDSPEATLARGVGPRAFAMLFGRPPRVSILHPDWADYRQVEQSVRRRAGNGRILHVKNGQGVLDAILGGSPVASLGEALGGGLGASGLDLVVLELQRGEMSEIRRAIELLRPRLAAGGEIIVFVKAGTAADATLGDDVLRLIDRIAPQEVHKTEAFFAGGRMSMRLRALLQRASGLYTRRGWKALPLVAVCVLVVAAVAFFNNRRLRSMQDRGRGVADCSSITICYRA